MKENFSKCKNCLNFDKEKSNENWIVCPVIPISVLIAKTSDNCPEFKNAENSEVDNAKRTSKTKI